MARQGAMMFSVENAWGAVEKSTGCMFLKNPGAFSENDLGILQGFGGGVCVGRDMYVFQPGKALKTLAF